MRQRYRFSREGDVLRLQLWADPGAYVPEHLHPTIEERFHVREGEFTFKVDGRKHRAGPGERLAVAPGHRHSFKNTGEGVAHFEAEIEPALEMQALFEESVALAQAGTFMRPGIPKGLRGLLAATEFAERYSDIYRQTFPPAPIQRVLFPRLARLQHRRQEKAGVGAAG